MPVIQTSPVGTTLIDDAADIKANWPVESESRWTWTSLPAALIRSSSLADLLGLGQRERSAQQHDRLDLLVVADLLQSGDQLAERLAPRRAKGEELLGLGRFADLFTEREDGDHRLAG